MEELDLATRNKVDALLRERRDALAKRWLGALFAIGASALLLAFFDKAVPDQVPQLLLLGAAVLAVAFAAASVVVPRRMLSDRAVAEHLRAPIDVHRCAMRMGLTDAQRDVFLALPPEEQKLFALTLEFERPYTVALLLVVGVVGAGLAYGLSLRGLLETTPYLLGALALLCWHYPRLTGLLDRGRALLKAEEEQADVREVDDLEQVKQLEARPPQQRGPRLRTAPRIKPKKA